MPPDRLSVTLRAPGTPDFRVALDCAIADHDACMAVVSALRASRERRGCAADRAGGDASLLVAGTLGGSDVERRVTRRTDCEIALYDRIVAGLGL